jgi:hypothetical protein
MKKQKLYYIIAFLSFICFQSRSQAEEKSFHLAIGGGLSFYNRQEYGESKFTQLAPEFVTFGYIPIYKNLWFRPALRLNYSWQQPDMPKALRIEETDFRYLLEFGLVFDWIVIPSFSYAFGQIYRATKFKTQFPITYAKDDISGTKNIPISQFQLGLGFPIAKGFIVVEPYTRYTIVQNDKRYGWGYGIEITFQIF